LGFFSESHPIPNADVAITSFEYLASKSFISTARRLPSKHKEIIRKILRRICITINNTFRELKCFTLPCFMCTKYSADRVYVGEVMFFIGMF
jgi:hypothetical protein